ncbi:MAG: CoA transferase [Deltaproteobacteria bacterium]|nr:CoA transferase [Deltaproteobacteria bacterium]
MARKPLQGLRVVDLAWVWSGPYCCMLLAHLGADVIKVESSSRLCMTRSTPPWPDGKPLPPTSGGGIFASNNLGKRSVTFNLKTPGGLAATRHLISTSDVVVNNYAAGVMERLGLGYDDLKKLKSDIILISLSGYGETGPYRNYVAYGQAQAALSGFTKLTGHKGSSPKNCGFVLADPNAGVHGAFAVLAALRHRLKTGQGQCIDLSQWEATLQLMGEGLMEYQLAGKEPGPNDGNRHPQMAPHGVFRCRDMEQEHRGIKLDRWVSIAVATEEQWSQLCAAMEKPELANAPRFATHELRKRNEDELEDIIKAWTRPQAPDEVTRPLQAVGVPAFTCNTYKDVFEDANLTQRGFFVDIDHPTFGVRTHPGVPWRMSNAPTEITRPSPLLGQHTEEVLKELGYSDGEIEALRQADALT